MGLYFFGGLNYEQIDIERLYRKFAYYPSVNAIRIFAHVGQRHRNGQLTKYNYGTKCNLVKYGNSTPPSYDISLVTNPNMILWHGTNDFIVDSTDIERLKNELKGISIKRFINIYLSVLFY